MLNTTKKSKTLLFYVMLGCIACNTAITNQDKHKMTQIIDALWKQKKILYRITFILLTGSLLGLIIRMIQQKQSQRPTLKENINDEKLEDFKSVTYQEEPLQEGSVIKKRMIQQKQSQQPTLYDIKIDSGDTVASKKEEIRNILFDCYELDKEKINYDNLGNFKSVTYQEELLQEGSVIKNMFEQIYEKIRKSYHIDQKNKPNFDHLDTVDNAVILYQSAWDTARKSIDKLYEQGGTKHARDDELKNILQQIMRKILEKDEIFQWAEQLVIGLLKCDKGTEGIRMLYNNIFLEFLQRSEWSDPLQKIFNFILAFRDNVIDHITNNPSSHLAVHISRFYKRNVFAQYGYPIMQSDLQDTDTMGAGLRGHDPFGNTYDEVVSGNFYEKPLKAFKNNFNICTIAEYILSHTQTVQEDLTLRSNVNQSHKTAILNDKPISLADVGYVLTKYYQNPDNIPLDTLDYESLQGGLTPKGAIQVVKEIFKQRNLLKE